MRLENTHLQFLFLFSETSWLMRRDLHDRARQLKMTQTQARALAVIARREGLTQTALAQRLEVQPMTVVRLIDRMQRAGLVRREKDPKDRRAIGLYLTAKAKPALQKLWAIAEGVRTRALTGLSSADEGKLLSLMEKIKANFGPLSLERGQQLAPRKPR